jgi:4'-phosphopantetheinyl transferase EntD
MVVADVADTGQELALPPQEAAHVAAAGEKRRRDFALGRHCARAALERLGRPASAVATDARGAPLWPDGIAGSITHTAGYAACVVAHAADFIALGIDAEHIDDVRPSLYGKLFRPGERSMLAGLADDERRRAAAILFSAKEAFYKACLAADGPIQFQALEVTLHADGFIVASDAGMTAAGRYLTADGLVVTLVAVPV